MSGVRDGASPGDLPAAETVIEALFRQEGPGLRRYFLRRLRNGEDALDYVQEAFTRLVHAFHHKPPARPASYLRSIAIHMLIARSRQTRVVQCELSFEIAVPAEQDHALLADETMRIYQSALNGLPERTRSVFLLYRLEGLKYREIAEALDISIPAVQKHMARALERITLALNVQD
jgi:RNA polymerase sigma factor (sigma-70 family)